MEDGLYLVIVLLVCIIGILLGKIYLLRTSADRIREDFEEKITGDTNTLIDLPGRDRTMRRLADSINEQLRILRTERIRLQQGDLEIRDAITNVSHDLRTPLTAICGYLDLLQQEEKSSKAGEYLEIIENRTETLKQLTEELFRYTIVTSKREEELEEEVDVNRVLEESISANYAVLTGCSIEPDIRICKERVIRRGNRGALARVFNNLISNAVKYSDGDLKVTLSPQGEIVFTNHAKSLNEVEVGKLFDRFYTVESARKSTGLGLSIAKALLEQMGGSISASYQEGILYIIIRL